MLIIRRFSCGLPLWAVLVATGWPVGLGFAAEGVAESPWPADADSETAGTPSDDEWSIPGDALHANSSVSFKVRLGRTGYGELAGGVVLAAKRPVKDMALPKSFAWLGSVNKQGLEVLVDPNATDVIRQAVTPTLLMDMPEDKQAKFGATDIRLYHRPTPLPAKVGGLYPVAGLKPYKTHRVEALAVDDSGAVTQLLATSDPDANPATDDQEQWLWTWVETEAGETGWAMSVDIAGRDDPAHAMRIDTVTEIKLGDGRRRKTRTVKDPNDKGNVEKTVVEVFQMFEWGEELIEKRVGYSGKEVERLIYTFYDDPADVDNIRMTRSVVDTYGQWEHYRYGSFGDDYRVLIETITPMNGNEYRPDDLDALRAANRVEAVWHATTDLDDADAEEERITRWIISSAGTVVRCHYEIKWSQSNPGGAPDPRVYEKWKLEAADALPEADYADTIAFLNAMLAGVVEPRVQITKTRRIERGQRSEYELARVERSTGEVAEYQYPKDGVTVITKGQLNRAGDTLVHAKRTTETVDASGHPISTYVEQLSPNREEGGVAKWFALSLEKALTREEFGRVTSTGHYFDAEAKAEQAKPGSGVAAYTTQQTYGRYGVTSRTDRDGQVTRYEYDGLGRLAAKTVPDGVTHRYTYDAAGRLRINLEHDDESQSPPAFDPPDVGKPQRF